MSDKFSLGGALLSPPDPRDYSIARGMEVSGEELPAQFEVWTPPVENQGKIGNCVAQSLACIMECIDHRDGLDHKDRSVGYIYGMSTCAEYSSGMYPRDACDALLKEGDVYRSLWECLKENPACSEERAKVGNDIKVKAKRPMMYVRINSEEELKRFILKYQLPVMVVVQVEEVWNSIWGTGLHALACYGWDDSKLRKVAGKYMGDNLHMLNSWGKGGAYGDGTKWTSFDKFKEVWGIVPMEEKRFTDVEENRWSAAAIKWAAENGLLIGYEDGTFRPDKPLTREELAAVLQRLASK